jgi:hypothetical protein
MNKLNDAIEPETKLTNCVARTDKLLKCAQSPLALIDVNAVECFSRLSAWKAACDCVTSAQWDTIVEHLTGIQEHVLGVQDELVHFHNSVPEPQEMADTAPRSGAEPRDRSIEDKLLRLGERAVDDAYRFETELREMFGFHFIDGELDSALLPAMEIVVEKAEIATKEGLAIAALYKLIHGHPRAFGRYFAGNDRPYPRPSKEVQAEIDAKTPTYIAHLQDELAEAIEEESKISRPASIMS